ncbi:hypothetical protein CAEBREN_21715 [Caenorhabditis brenneri]|uniref:F-box domain-containing protein n=1 Tax=Caenorhabditis brenneri TaxID=135651 RepID=G0MHI2_CAEBE|nr:hypothetical protein CAEBREN_21715 [Caenorhabditis brenneri]
MNIENLPSELLVQILDDCDFADCMCFRATSSKNYDVGNYVLAKTKTFDFRRYNDHRHVGIQSRYVETDKKKNSTNLNPTKLGKSLPKLNELVIAQNEEKLWIDKDALMGLTYFRGLESLAIIGWEPSNITRRGCAARNEVLPQSTLRNLVKFTIICKRETVSKILHYIIDNKILMTKCVKAKFSIRFSISDLPLLAMKFMEYHPKLLSICFEGLLFITQEQVESFYNHILALCHLEKVRLENCSVVDRINREITNTFLESLQERNIKFTNTVKSMSYG